tara:strand:+ start:553 stop:672 length:120 start_codon:yes stop_codon:yes gene_type:complete
MIMVQAAILSHPDFATTGTGHQTRENGWSPRLKFIRFLA